VRIDVKRTLVGAGLAALLLGGGATVFAQTQNGPTHGGDIAAMQSPLFKHSGNGMPAPVAAWMRDHAGQMPAFGGGKGMPFGGGAAAGMGPGNVMAGMAGRMAGRPGQAPVLGAAAKYLGLSQSQLRSDLRAGQSLAQIAVAQGKGVAGLETAMVNGIKTHLAKAVTNGNMTSAQEQQIFSRIQMHIGTVVQHGISGAAGNQGAGNQ
jgi:hypothetical protein